MLIGKCPKCNAIYRGWALKSPWSQACDRCGADLEIRDHEAVSEPDNRENPPEQNLTLFLVQN